MRTDLEEKYLVDISLPVFITLLARPLTNHVGQRLIRFRIRIITDVCTETVAIFNYAQGEGTKAASRVRTDLLKD